MELTQQIRNEITSRVLPERHLIILEAIVNMHKSMSQVQAQDVVDMMYNRNDKEKYWNDFYQDAVSGNPKSEGLIEDIDYLYLRGFVYYPRETVNILPTQKAKNLYERLHYATLI